MCQALPQCCYGTNAALLIPPGDPKALTEALLQLAHDPALAARLARNAAAQGRRHDWADNARAVMALMPQKVPA